VAVAIARARVHGEAQNRGVYARETSGAKHSTVGVFTPARSCMVGRPWRSTGRRSHRREETRCSRPTAMSARTHMVARACEGSQRPFLYPVLARVLRQPTWQRPQRHCERVSRVRCNGAEPKARPCLPSSVHVCASARARGCARGRACAHAEVTSTTETRTATASR
jgi:hypothetical protein